MKRYISYEIYEAPSKPTEHGKYIGKTPILEQAMAVASHGNRFIKGVTESGEKVALI